MLSPVAPDKRETPPPNVDAVARRRQAPSVVQLGRFIVVGLFAAGVYLVSTDLLHQYTRMSVAVAASISFVFVVTTNYVLHYSWTFRSSRRHASAVPREPPEVRSALEGANARKYRLDSADSGRNSPVPARSKNDHGARPGLAVMGKRMA